MWRKQSLAKVPLLGPWLDRTMFGAQLANLAHPQRRPDGVPTSGQLQANNNQGNQVNKGTCKSHVISSLAFKATSKWSTYEVLFGGCMMLGGVAGSWSETAARTSDLQMLQMGHQKSFKNLYQHLFAMQHSWVPCGAIADQDGHLSAQMRSQMS